jgi:hypothetical protein
MVSYYLLHLSIVVGWVVLLVTDRVRNILPKMIPILSMSNLYTGETHGR